MARRTVSMHLSARPDEPSDADLARIEAGEFEAFFDDGIAQEGANQNWLKPAEIEQLNRIPLRERMRLILDKAVDLMEEINQKKASLEENEGNTSVVVALEEMISPLLIQIKLFLAYLNLTEINLDEANREISNAFKTIESIFNQWKALEATILVDEERGEIGDLFEPFDDGSEDEGEENERLASLDGSSHFDGQMYVFDDEGEAVDIYEGGKY